MNKLSEDIVRFFQDQGFVIVSTIDKVGAIHNSCKGIVEINQKGQIYLLDVYKNRTYQNLKDNPCMSIAAVDEHKFKGYCLKGRAEIVSSRRLKPRMMKSWEDRINSRITRRLIKNIREEKGHPRHPEALLPKPEYMIVMETQEIVDLTPHHLK